MENIYDLVIIGGGPAGITAGIYAKRAGLKVCLLEANFLGGEVNNTFEVDNYPGFHNINGMELMQKMGEHLQSLNVEIIYENATKIQNENEEIKTIILSSGNIIKTKTIILAIGAKPRKLNAPGEEEFAGRGVSYCAVCDGAFFRNKDVAVIGGGNTAMENAIYLSNVANKVYILNRSEKYRADIVLLNRARAIKNIAFIENATTNKIVGSNTVEALEFTQKSEPKTLNTGGVFVSIGKVADTSLLPTLNLDEFGYIKVNEHMQTSIQGIYACGDIIAKPLKQIITACSDGAIAATSAANYVLNK